MSATAVHATVTGARNLPKADWFGHSDLYVLCQVQPRPEVHGQTKVARTNLENNLLNPVWNETLHMQPYYQGETLEFKVMDRETLRSVELGRAVLQWPDSTRRGFRGALPIQMASPPSNTQASPLLDVAVSVDVPEVQQPDMTQSTGSQPVGQLPPTAQQPTPTSPPTAPASPQDSQQSMTVVTQQQTQPVQYPPQQYTYTQTQQQMPPQTQPLGSIPQAGPMRVRLAMISGRNFPDTGYMSTKDAFCICQIPGRPALDCQTPVCKNSVNPLWNSEHEIHDFHPGDTLEFIAYNKQTWPLNDERLGVARLQLDPAAGHDGFLPLTDETNTKANAAINVRAAVIGAAAGPASAQAASVAGNASSRVGVNIVSARNLRVDPNRSEVFCTARVLDKPETEIKSVAVQGTSQPVFNMNQELPNYTAGDTLEIAVYDQAGGVPRSVGGATLPGSYILPSGWHGDLPIYELADDDSETPPINVGVLQAKIGPIGQPAPQVQQQQDATGHPTHLRVQVHGAEDLPYGNHGQFSDTFCVVKVWGRPHSEFHTDVVHDAEHPVWNCERDITNYSPGHNLEFEVFDKDGWPRSDDLLGVAVLPAKAFASEAFHGSLPLEHPGGRPISTNARLRVSVVPLDPASPQVAQIQEVSQTSYTVQNQAAQAPPPSPPPTTVVYQQQPPPQPPPQQTTIVTNRPPAQSYPAPVRPVPPPYCGCNQPYVQQYGPPGYAVQPYTAMMPPASYQGMPPPAYPMMPPGGCMYHGPCTVQLPPSAASVYPMQPGGVMVHQYSPGYAAGIDSPVRQGSEASYGRLQRNLAYSQNAYRTEMEQRREIKDAFETFDTNRSGYVDYYSLKCSMRALGFPVRKADVLEAMREEGCMETGRISFDEFSRILMRKYGEREPLDDILRVFRYFDKEGKGRISLADLRKVVAELGEGLSESDLQCMIEEFDENRDGCINESEFVKVMQSAVMH